MAGCLTAAECGRCREWGRGVWGSRCLEVMEVGGHGMWELQCQGVAKCRSCVMWGLECVWVLECEGPNPGF